MDLDYDFLPLDSSLIEHPEALLPHYLPHCHIHLERIHPGLVGLYVEGITPLVVTCADHP